MLRGLKDQKNMSKKQKKQLKNVEKKLIATSLKLSAFQRQIEIQRQEKRSIEVFFNTWRTNVKKMKKNQGLLDLVNPIGVYLQDLYMYINNQQSKTKDVKMFTEEDLAAIQSTKLFKNKLDLSFDLKEVLSNIIKTNTTSSVEERQTGAELNILLLTRNVSVNKDEVLFNQVLDSLIFTLSNLKVSLFDLQNSLQPVISYQETLKDGRLTYNLRYRESSLLTKPKQAIKVDLTKNSLLMVLIKDPIEIQNLAILLDSALPKMAGLNLVLFSLNLDPKMVQKRIAGMLARLINNKKVASIKSCPINISQSDAFEKARQRRVQLNLDEFSKYLQFHTKQDITQALKSAPLIWANEIYQFRAIPLDELVRDVFNSFKILFDYAVSKNPVIFEAEFLKYFNLTDEDLTNLQNCLQVTNCWIQAMEQSLKSLIKFCELSCQTLHAHGRTDTEAFNDFFIFLPKLIASKEERKVGRSSIDIPEDLEVKHMAYLLRRSLFSKNIYPQIKKKDIRVSLANIEYKSETAIWQSQSAIFKGTLIAGVYLENLLKRCSGHSIYLLERQVEECQLDLQKQQLAWEKKLTASILEQVQDQNGLETSYPPLLAQRYPEDFDTQYKAQIKRKYNERLALLNQDQRRKVKKSSSQKQQPPHHQQEEEKQRKAIADKRQAKQEAKGQQATSSRIEYIEGQMYEKIAKEQYESLEAELMQLASYESEDSSQSNQSCTIKKSQTSMPQKKAKRSTNEEIEQEVQEFMKSITKTSKNNPDSSPTVNIDSGRRGTKSGKKYEGKDCAAAIFELIDSM